MFNFFKKTKNFITFSRTKLFSDEIAKPQDAQGFYNFLQKLPNPDVVLRASGLGYKSLRDLKSNYQVGTCIESRKAGVTSKKWKLEKGDSSAKEYDFWTEIFKYLDVYKIIEDILEAPLFGFAPITVRYEADGQYILPAELTAKPQEWFYFDAETNFYFNSKSKDNDLIDLKNPKILLPRHRATFLNPYGECLLSRCYWNVVFINSSFDFWVRFVEKYGSPFAVGKYDRNMTNEEKETMLKTLIDMIQDCAAVIPNDSTVELMEAAGKSASADIYKGLITKCENNISKVILGQTLTTDIGSSGSYAAANTHQQVREDLILSDVRLVEKTMNEFILKVHSLNFNDTSAPIFNIYDEEDIDQSLAERDNKIKTLGVTFTKDYIKRAYGFEDGDFDMAEPSEPVNFSDSEEPNKTKDEQNDFDKMDELIPEDYEKLINPLLMPIVELFKQERDADVCMEKIAEIYPLMNTEQLEDMLTKVIFLAEMLGRVSNG
ncbi:MAG: DUF935 domain-containing protein [Candidatus Gastranaerophilales bacterium]|nr:DUF935 domain-containing protein [Candidatus Gastranaerophilales bacterium]